MYNQIQPCLRSYKLAKEKNINTKERANVSKTSTISKIPEGVPLSSIPVNTVWYSIRKGLIEELGEAIDKAWFSKAIAKECSKTATLTMPTRFMADWIKNNYSHVILRLAGNCRIKRVEYRCA